jgi:hypothetical protein
VRRLFIVAIVALSMSGCLAGLADWICEAQISGPDYEAAKHGFFELSPPATRFAKPK